MSDGKSDKEEAADAIKELIEQSPLIMMMGLKASMQKIQEMEEKIETLEKDVFELKTILKYHPEFKK